MEMVERFGQTETGKERFMRFTHYLQTSEGSWSRGEGMELL